MYIQPPYYSSANHFLSGKTECLKNQWIIIFVNKKMKKVLFLGQEMNIKMLIWMKIMTMMIVHHRWILMTILWKSHHRSGWWRKWCCCIFISRSENGKNLGKSYNAKSAAPVTPIVYDKVKMKAKSGQLLWSTQSWYDNLKYLQVQERLMFTKHLV